MYAKKLILNANVPDVAKSAESLDRAKIFEKIDAYEIAHDNCVTENIIAVALSGGADSLALLSLVKERLGPRDVHAIIVDHALRAGSDEDAKHAARQAEKLGCIAHIKIWKHEGVSSAIQERARIARYSLLAEGCADVGANFIMTGHSEDDQAETISMRMDNGSGWRGLAGIAERVMSPIWPQTCGLEICRPLLTTSRAALRAYCKQQGLEFLDDPANENPDYQRIRARRELAVNPDKRARLLEIGQELGAKRDAEQARLKGWIQHHLHWMEFGAVSFAHEALLDMPVAALADVLRIASGTAMRADMAKVEGLFSHIRPQNFKPRTLGGALVTCDGFNVLVTRDPGALLGRNGAAPPRLSLEPNIPAIWDGRVHVMGTEPGISVGALWPARLQLDKTAKAKLRAFKPSIRRTLPGFFRGETLIAAPHILTKPYDASFYAENIAMQRFF